MEEFNQQSLYFLNLDDNIMSQWDEDDEEGEEIQDDEDKDTSVTEDDKDNDTSVTEVSNPVDEEIHLLLPSKIGNTHGGLEEVKLMELDLRKGQANDALEGLRESLGYKSMLI